MREIIDSNRSIIPACDVKTLSQLEKIVEVAKEFTQIKAYKIGPSLGLTYGLPLVVKLIKAHNPDAIVIYDHQKAGTDIPDSAEMFASTMAYANINAAIIFPMAGPSTQRAFINSLRAYSINTICGGEMTHKNYKISEGGYIDDTALEKMYTLAVELGVTNFVVPGNRADRIKTYKKLIEGRGVTPTFYSPGLVSQGGDLTEAGNAAGPYWHAICGRAIYNPKGKGCLDATEEEMRESIKKLVANL